MQVAPRYATLVAILDDPLNRACIERELVRRRAPKEHKGLLPPPIPRVGGGLVYPTMREFQRTPHQEAPAGEEIDCVADLFQGTEGWFVVLDDGTEVGPFDTMGVARKQAENLLQKQGYTLLGESPWGQTEATTYPIKKNYR
jgi:hypothetical protein